MKRTTYLSFLGISLTVMGLGIFTVGLHFSSILPPTHGAHWLYWMSLIAAFSCMIFSFSVKNLQWDAWPLTSLHLLASILFGFFTLALPLILVRQVITLFIWLIPGESLVSVEEWTAKSSVAIIIACTILILIGVFGALKTPRIQNVRVRLKKLPTEFQGLRIVQISDLHLATTLPTGFVKRVVARTKLANPDVIVLTGDLVDGPVETLKNKAELLRNLSAPLGKYFVTGNHEYYSGVETWLPAIKNLGFKILMNSHVILSHNRGEIALGGIPDWKAGRISSHHPDISKAFAGAPDNIPKILLSHQPNSAPAAQKHGIDLQLSGHTHGGQYWPWGLFASRVNIFLSGLNYLGNTAVYVSRGTGYWGPPLRFKAPSEITAIDLEAFESPLP